MRRSYVRLLFAFFAVLATLALVTVEADARSRISAGSRGTRTFSAPPPTATAPKAARPIERTMTQPGAATAARPASPAAAPAAGGFLNRPGLLGGLAAGFLGAGLFGMLFGHGLMGGLGGIASFLGLLLQIGIVVLVAMFVWRWWQSRSQPATAFAGGPALRQGMASGSDAPSASSPMSLGGLGGFGGLGGSKPATADVPIELKPEDFDAFERLQGEILTAYGAEDLNALRARVTPEMLSYYAEELNHNAANGDINPISDVKLLQGDLSEAWREDGDEYATVAMRYSLNDRLIDRKDGRLIEQLPSEVTELWTFRRAAGGGNWILSAIQQND
jgi:predicted lipid-binding transport protein (Tim44 family)